MQSLIDRIYATVFRKRYSERDVASIIKLQRRIRETRKTRWMKLCYPKTLSDEEFRELQTIAKNQGVIQYETKSKRQLCADLASAFELKPIAQLILPNGMGWLNQISDLFLSLKTFPVEHANVFIHESTSFFINYKDAKTIKKSAVVENLSLSTSWFQFRQLSKEEFDAITERFVILPIELGVDGGVNPFEDQTIEEIIFAVKKGYVYSHQNVIIFDKKLNIAYRYEPYFMIGVDIQLKIHREIEKSLQERYGIEYLDGSVLSENGPQTIYNGELCVLYCAFFVYRFLQAKNRYFYAVEYIRNAIKEGVYMDEFLSFIRQLVTRLGRDFFIHPRWPEGELDMLPTRACIICGKYSLLKERYTNRIFCSKKCQLEHVLKK